MDVELCAQTPTAEHNNPTTANSFDFTAQFNIRFFSNDKPQPGGMFVLVNPPPNRWRMLRVSGAAVPARTAFQNVPTGGGHANRAPFEARTLRRFFDRAMAYQFDWRQQ